MSAEMSHEAAFELLPWVANGTLQGEERERVDRHVASCLVCRSELKSQTVLQRVVKERPTLSWSAQTSFDRLAQRLDTPRTHPVGTLLASLSRRPVRLAAACLVLVAVGAVAWLGLGREAERDAAPFATLTQGSAQQAVLVDLVFAAGVGEADVRAFVGELGATVVAGPSAVGRYTIRLSAEARTDEQRDALLSRLEADPRVRFAGLNFIEPPRAP